MDTGDARWECTFCTVDSPRALRTVLTFVGQFGISCPGNDPRFSRDPLLRSVRSGIGILEKLSLALLDIIPFGWNKQTAQ